MAASLMAQINGNIPSLKFLLMSNHSRPLLPIPYRSMRLKATMAQDKSYWVSIDEDIVTHLKKAIQIKPPLCVFEPMHHLTFAVPPITAPALCIASCELVGGRREDATATASAIHLMYAATYSHAHLPLTDRAKPKPKTAHAFGPNIELLTGDGLIPFGFELLASSDQNNSEKILRVIIEIARATGSQGMVDGQYNNFQYSQSTDHDSANAEVMRQVCEEREGKLNACAAACGAIVGGGSEDEIEKLRKFGFYLGMIQGMLYGIERNEKGLRKEKDELRNLALNELRSFNGVTVEALSSLVDVDQFAMH